MNKISNITPQPEFNYLGAKLSNRSENLAVSTNKKQVTKLQYNSRRESRQVQKKKSRAIFKYLIFTTIVIFTFGGLGFGLALRYGNNIQASSTSNINR